MVGKKHHLKRKRSELIECISEIDINIPRMNLPELQEKAVRHYNELWSAGGEWGKMRNLSDCNKSFLNRVCINMLRCDNKHSEDKIKEMYGVS